MDEQTLSQYDDLTKFENFNNAEKSKEYQIVQDHQQRLYAVEKDVEIMKCLNRPAIIERANEQTSHSWNTIHYTRGFFYDDQIITENKLNQANNFLLSIKQQRRNQSHKLQQIEKEQQEQERVEYELFIQQQKMEEERKRREILERIEKTKQEQEERKKLRDLIENKNESNNDKQNKNKQMSKNNAKNNNSISQNGNNVQSVANLLAQKPKKLKKNKSEALSTKLLREFEANYQKRIVLPELQRREHELKKRREKLKPFEKGLFQKWSEEYDAVLEKQKNEKLEKLEKEKSKHKEYIKPEYESKFYGDYALEATKARHIKSQEKQRAQEIRDKYVTYDQRVKEEHPVLVKKQLDDLKVNEILDLKKINERSRSVDENKPLRRKQIGLEYLQKCKQDNKTELENLKKSPSKIHSSLQSQLNKSITPSQGNYRKNDYSVGRSTKRLNDDFSLPTIGTQSARHNYMIDLRNSGIIKKGSNRLDYILKRKNLGTFEKYEMLRDQDYLINQKINQMESKRKTNTKSKDDEMVVFDDLCIGSIKAKLDLLNSIEG